MLAWGWELGPGLLGQSLFEWKSCSEVGFCPDPCPDVLLMRKEKKGTGHILFDELLVLCSRYVQQEPHHYPWGSRVFTFHSLRPLGQVYSPKCLLLITPKSFAGPLIIHRRHIVCTSDKPLL